MTDARRPSEDARTRRPRGTKRPASDDEDDNAVEDEGPACHSCRKRKAKCSRQQPCRQCERLNVDCIYDEKRQRPGMRTGAIEALNQRLTSLEHMFLGQGILLRPLLAQLSATPESSHHSDLSGETDALRRQLLSVAQERSSTDAARDRQQAWHSTGDEPPQAPSENAGAPITDSLTDSALPPPEVVDHLVDLYFQQIHPWIPILHISNTKQQLKDPVQREKLSTILHSIVSVCLRIDDSEYARSLGDVKARSLRCRHTVILRSMEAFSVRNLQALVIIAFDIIGSGRGPSAWSVVGSMARTVEQLQLSVEDNQDDTHKAGKQSLINRMAFLRPPDSWIEAEERRRVFWTVFLMDRFCSVATGWNNSLTSADVRRKLPCEGALWYKGKPIRTPYFGVAERSSMHTAASSLVSTGERYPADEEEVDNIGGFAFCIEATESLNLVTTFFLRQALNFDSPQEIQLWLMKFKELDLRLVKWRLFLPSRWADAAAPNSEGLMDPNLALAHITHNTAVIQLHQCIAYPSTRWKTCSIALPSATSSETCVTAATEIRTIAQQYLSMSKGVINPQFSLCLFIAGRVFLAHCAYNSLPLPEAFGDIITCLQMIAERWNNSKETNDNLASRFASRLRHAQAVFKGEAAPQRTSLLDMRQPVYSDDFRASKPATRRSSFQAGPPNLNPSQSQHPIGTTVEQPATPYATGFSPDSISLAFPPMPLSMQQHQDFSGLSGVEGAPNHNYMITQANAGEHIVAPSQMSMQGFDDMANIFDAPFQEMLRVSTYGN